MTDISTSQPIASGFIAPLPPSITDLAGLVPPPKVFAEGTPLCTSGVIRVYLAGCPALSGIARTLGVHILKIGVTTRPPNERIHGLNRTKYAGFWGPRGKLLPLEGADQWKQFRVWPNFVDGQIKRDHVILDPYGHFNLSVPPSMERTHVDSAVSTLFAPRSLRAFLATDAAKIRCAQTGINPAAWFWTQYEGPDQQRMLRPVRELYVIDSIRDAPMIMNALNALGGHLRRDGARTSGEQVSV